MIDGKILELSKEENSWFGEEKLKLIPIVNPKNIKIRERRKNKIIERLYLLFLRDMGICQLCKRPVKLKNVSIDHILAKNNGGTDDIDNLQISHEFCNSIKGDIWKPLKPEYFINHKNYGYRKNK